MATSSKRRKPNELVVTMDTIPDDVLNLIFDAYLKYAVLPAINSSSICSLLVPSFCQSLGSVTIWESALVSKRWRRLLWDLQTELTAMSMDTIYMLTLRGLSLRSLRNLEMTFDETSPFPWFAVTMPFLPALRRLTITQGKGNLQWDVDAVVGFVSRHAQQLEHLDVPIRMAQYLPCEMPHLHSLVLNNLQLHNELPPSTSNSIEDRDDERRSSGSSMDSSDDLDNDEVALTSNDMPDTEDVTLSGGKFRRGITIPPDLIHTLLRRYPSLQELRLPEQLSMVEQLPSEVARATIEQMARLWVVDLRLLALEPNVELVKVAAEFFEKLPNLTRIVGVDPQFIDSEACIKQWPSLQKRTRDTLLDVVSGGYPFRSAVMAGCASDRFSKALSVFGATEEWIISAIHYVDSEEAALACLQAIASNSTLSAEMIETLIAHTVYRSLSVGCISAMLDLWHERSKTKIFKSRVKLIRAADEATAVFLAESKMFNWTRDTIVDDLEAIGYSLPALQRVMKRNLVPKDKATFASWVHPPTGPSLLRNLHSGTMRVHSIPVLVARGLPIQSLHWPDVLPARAVPDLTAPIVAALITSGAPVEHLDQEQNTILHLLFSSTDFARTVGGFIDTFSYHRGKEQIHVLLAACKDRGVSLCSKNAAGLTPLQVIPPGDAPLSFLEALARANTTTAKDAIAIAESCSTHGDRDVVAGMLLSLGIIRQGNKISGLGVLNAAQCKELRSKWKKARDEKINW